MERKFKIGYFSFILLMLFVSMAVSQDSYNISGEIQYTGSHNIFVCLYDQKTWSTWKKELPPASFVFNTKADPSGITNFMFSKVPKNDYVILVFVDVNDNGRLDSDSWGFVQELYDFYKPMQNWPNWNDQKVSVDKDLKGIVIKFR